MLVVLAYISVICYLAVAEANTISALIHDTVTKYEIDDEICIDVSYFAR